MFGCIDVEQGSTLTIFVTGDEPNLVSHPVKITNVNDLGQAMAPLPGVIKTDLTSGPKEDHTYSLTWVVPCDDSIGRYQYQCENHAHMRGIINVIGGPCPTPTPTDIAAEYDICVTPTPTPTPTDNAVEYSLCVTPTPTPTPTDNTVEFDECETGVSGLTTTMSQDTRTWDTIEDTWST